MDNESGKLSKRFFVFMGWESGSPDAANVSSAKLDSL